MISVWILSTLILSYTLGGPLFKNTSGSNMETSPNVTKTNFTEFTTPTNRSVRLPKFLRRCLLSTCGLWNLGALLQTGNEVAGDFTNDPFGFGKK
ncbi:uncharacterized protein zgc:193726 isoform X4 [Danio aesculapii]|uniref:uncharacterized protein zgc:193726 isoform X4 n=1 Tax=Danio aesculapii TaxID=1142201 RepID=UPI0024BFAA24|nr:uncharacterized protein zgc:193726 isoform X4 [Danio aesculapii]